MALMIPKCKFPFKIKKDNSSRTCVLLGVFMVTLATLMFEILISRIFSVTMWYHFAFVAVSIAMFGMTVGAIIIYLFPDFFTEARVKYHLILSSLLFSVSIIIGFLVHIWIPFRFEKTLSSFFSISATYAAISVPFVFSGICVCLALTKFPRQISKIYAADLAGAAMGCILIIYTLKIADGPTSVFAVSFLASLGGAFFSKNLGRGNLQRISYSLVSVLAVLFLVQIFLVHKQTPLIRLKWVKGGQESRPIYEKWNSFSRITVGGDPERMKKPIGWGLSSVYPSDRIVNQLLLRIDSTAETVITEFDGDLENLEHLRYDITNIVHFLRSNADVLVVGAGGGRDILSALVFNQKTILGIELNKNIIDAINKEFGDFAGHLDQNSRVRFVNDEARSFIARQTSKYDVIQVSLIDTWAATAAGAFVLSENSLYTVEAWKIFLDHLTDEGILTFSRWYFRDSPGETYRLTSLASVTLLELGIEKPRDHIIIERKMLGADEEQPDGIGTILVSKQPFTRRDIETISEVCEEKKFELVLSPEFSLDANFAKITSGESLKKFFSEFPLDISAPRDESPFFFHMLRLRDFFKRELWGQGFMIFNIKAIIALAILLITVTVLTLLCILVPLFLTKRKTKFGGSLPFFVFFAGIGLGFMFIEISQMQRLIIFLGHPTYGLSVVLFALLLSSGIGSFLTQKQNGEKSSRFSRRCLLSLILFIAVFGFITPFVIPLFQTSVTTLRILVSVGMLFPLGFFMGMAFPIGMKKASQRAVSLTPWLWGINGAMSVYASVLAIVVILNSTISTAYWLGFFCYAAAVASYFRLTRRKN